MAQKTVNICDNCGREVPKKNLYNLIGVALDGTPIYQDYIVNELHIELCESCFKNIAKFFDKVVSGEKKI